MEPFSLASSMKKFFGVAQAAHRKSEQEALLQSFEVETTKQSLALLDMLLAASTQHAHERGEEPAWMSAVGDSTLPAAARLEALAPLKESFLKLLRAAHDPILGNRMLALASAGLARLDYPEALEARVLIIASQLIPDDVDLLYRYYTEGVHKIEVTDDGHPHVFPRKLVQKDYVLHFILDEAGRVSEPLDSYSYATLKRYDLVQDFPWMGDPDRPRGKPPAFDFSPRHRSFKMEWRPSLLGQVVLEAFMGHQLIKLSEPSSIDRAGD